MTAPEQSAAFLEGTGSESWWGVTSPVPSLHRLLGPAGSAADREGGDLELPAGPSALQ